MKNTSNKSDNLHLAVGISAEKKDNSIIRSKGGSNLLLFPLFSVTLSLIHLKSFANQPNFSYVHFHIAFLIDWLLQKFEQSLVQIH